MLQKKIILNDRIRELIIDCRKNAKERNHLLRADYISREIGRADSWLSQVENGRLKSVKTNDLVSVFCILQNRNKDCPEDRKQVEQYLDDQIMYIMITQKHGIIDEKGDVPDFSEMVSFQSSRGHIKYAGENLSDIINQLLITPIEEIHSNLKQLINEVFNNVIDWYNRAFSDTASLFSDEISTINLYLLIETCIKVYNRNYAYFGLNLLDISPDASDILKEKLNTNYFLKGKTIVKPIDDYSTYDIDDVIRNFSIEEYMLWKNKRTYIGADPFPMKINFLSSRTSDDSFVTYKDVTTAFGLSQEEYLYIIKQIYYQADVFYKKCKYLLDDIQTYQDEIDDLYSEIENLKEQLKSSGS